jgi:hypothetical protein
MSIQVAVSESAKKFWPQKVADIVEDLRALADRVQREGDRAALDTRRRHPHVKAAENIIHDIMGALPNLGFSRLIELAAEADDLPWPEENG